VFRAWIDPDEIPRWLAPDGLVIPRDSVQIEAQAGGRFHLTMVDPRDGAAYPMRATIIEITVPELIVLRTDPIPEAGIIEPTVTTVTFEAIGQRTRMTVTGGSYPDEGFGKALAGWSSLVSNLDQLLRAEGT
jgi:uncharacterized protein YndB with AHSA1/START domain